MNEKRMVLHFLKVISIIFPSVMGLASCFDWMDDPSDRPHYDFGDESDGGGIDDLDWPAEWEAMENQVLVLVNERRAEGASCGTEGNYAATHSLIMESRLRRAARLHSQDMAERTYFSHDSPGGPNGDNVTERIENAGYLPWLAIGENIAAGQASAQQVVQTWMESDGHCANIMSPLFEEIGVGYYYTGNSSSYYHYWTQDFGTQ